jgi:hypothetical protein
MHFGVRSLVHERRVAMSKEVIGAVIGGLAVVGAALITGYYTLRAQPGDAPGPAPRPPGQEEAAVDITIHDELGDNQYSEALNIEIDGRSEGDLVIDRTTRPEAELTVSLNPGVHNYEIQGNTQAYDTYGNLAQFPVEGKGEITVSNEDNQSFDLVQLGVSGNVIIAGMEES